MINPSQKRKKEKSEEKSKSDQYNADPSEDKLIYGIDRLNLGKLYMNR